MKAMKQRAWPSGRALFLFRHHSDLTFVPLPENGESQTGSSCSISVNTSSMNMWRHIFIMVSPPPQKDSSASMQKYRCILPGRLCSEYGNKSPRTDGIGRTPSHSSKGPSLTNSCTFNTYQLSGKKDSTLRHFHVEIDRTTHSIPGLPSLSGGRHPLSPGADA